MLINHILGFVHGDFPFYFLTSYLDKKVRYIMPIDTLQSDSNCPNISPFPDN